MEKPKSRAAKFASLKAIPRGIWAIGFVSMFMDISSEMIHALLPIYLVTAMGASTLAVGIIEGIAEATASIAKVFSGAVSDWLGKRKLLVVIGYGLAAFTKPVFPLAETFGWLVGARFVDRIGKGIRGAPRDALLSDIAPANLRGASFGLRQSLDTIGAFIGPLIAIGLMYLTANNFKTVFWFAVIPAFISLALILFAVKEPPRAPLVEPVKFLLQRSQIARLSPRFWRVVSVASIFTLARFSEAFLILKAQAVGLPIALVPAIIVVMNIVYAASAYPVGVVSDGPKGRSRLLVIGLLLLIAADLVLGMAKDVWFLGVGVILWGLHMGFTQGLLSALVADTAPNELRGTAFGMFNLVTGIALLLASALAGYLWQSFGANVTFFAGASIAALSLIGFVILERIHAPTSALPSHPHP
jgi:MFS family permease